MKNLRQWVWPGITAISAIVLMAFVGLLHGQSYVNNGAASPSPGQGLLVTGTAQTVTLPSPAMSVTLRTSTSADLKGASASVVYARFLCTGAPSASPSPDVTLANGIPIVPGAVVTAKGPATECAQYPGKGTYSAFAVVAAPSPSPSPTAYLFASVP